MRISVTERGEFRRCRRKWYFTSHNKLSLTHKGVGAKYFAVGSMVHYALSENGKGNDPMEALADYITKFEERLVRTNTVPPNFEGMKEFTTSLVQHYFDFHGRNSFDPLVYKWTEETFRIPIPEWEHEEGELVGTFDAVLQDPSDDGIYIVDYKTFSVKPELYYLEYNDQFTAYAWAARELWGDKFRGIIYEGLSKKLPTDPTMRGKTITKTGKTTAAHLTKCLLSQGLNPADYLDVIRPLALEDKKQQSEFFTRFKLSFSDEALYNFEQRLIDEYNDMSDPNLKIYPNFIWSGCSDCNVRDLCFAMEHGYDWESIVKMSYSEGKGHATIQNQETPEINPRELLGDDL